MKERRTRIAAALTATVLATSLFTGCFGNGNLMVPQYKHATVMQTLTGSTPTYTVSGTKFDGIVVSTTGVNVRSEPSASGSLVGALPYNAELQVLGKALKDGQETGWYAIIYNGKTAYAIANAIGNKNPATPSTPGSGSKYTVSGTAFTGYVVSASGLNVRSEPNGSVVGALPISAEVQVLGEAMQDGKATGWYAIVYNGKTAYAIATGIGNKNPATPSTPGSETKYTVGGASFLGTVSTTKGLNVRATPSTNGYPVGALPCGAKVQVKGTAFQDGKVTEWYCIVYNGKTAYATIYGISGGTPATPTPTTTPPSTTTPSPTTTPITPDAGKPEYTLVGGGFTGYNISTTGLNVRDIPGTDGNILGHLAYGQEVEVLGTAAKNGTLLKWFGIKYNGGVGYVSSNSISGKKPEATTPSGGSSTTTYSIAGSAFTGYVISTAGLNVRTTPTTLGKLMGALPSGAKVQVLGTAHINGQATDWFGITYNGKTGYVSGRNISVSKNGPSAITPTPTTPPSGGSSTTTGEKYTVAGNSFTGYVISTMGLNVRTAPTTLGKLMGTLANGAKVQVLGTAYMDGQATDWFGIRYNGKTGYVSGRNIGLTKNGSAVISTPTTPSNGGTTPTASQYKVAGNSFTGYVISTMGLNVRSAPNVAGRLLGALPNGTKVQVLGTAYKNGQATEWYGITYKGQTAYVSAKNISTNPTKQTALDSVFTGYATAKLGLNVRSAPTATASTLGALGFGEKVDVRGLARQNGKVTDWYVVKYNGKTGYVSSKYVSQTNPK